jgi:2'-5' RNA ligase
MGDCIAVWLASDARTTIERVWAELESLGACREHGHASPHLTLAIVKRHTDSDQVRAVVRHSAPMFSPFPVTSAGYGVFLGHGGESPVIHLSITRTPRLSALHDTIVRSLSNEQIEIDGQYLPEHWRPHVTLADAGLTPPLIGAAIQHLVANAPRHLTFEVDNVSVVTADETAAFPLGTGAQ